MKRGLRSWKRENKLYLASGNRLPVWKKGGKRDFTASQPFTGDRGLGMGLDAQLCSLRLFWGKKNQGKQKKKALEKTTSCTEVLGSWQVWGVLAALSHPVEPCVDRGLSQRAATQRGAVVPLPSPALRSQTKAENCKWGRGCAVPSLLAPRQGRGVRVGGSAPAFPLQSIGPSLEHGFPAGAERWHQQSEEQAKQKHDTSQGNNKEMTVRSWIWRRRMTALNPWCDSLLLGMVLGMDQLQQGEF